VRDLALEEAERAVEGALTVALAAAAIRALKEGK
jgi:hypothetical protein